MAEPAYKRIMLKLSGEAIVGENGQVINFDVVGKICDQIIQVVQMGIEVGIVIGAGMIPLAIIGSVIIGVILLLLANRKYSDKPYMLVLRCENENAETAAMALLNQSGCRSKVKAKTVTRDGMELSVEVKLKDASTNFVNALSAVEGMHSVSMVSYNGEYMS